MRLYIAGPMRSCKDHNFPAFDACAKALRRTEMLPISPADLDRCISGISGHEGESALNSRFQRMEYMDRDLAILKWCDGIVLLDGWTASSGARLEKAYAEYFDLTVYLWDAEHERLVRCE